MVLAGWKVPDVVVARQGIHSMVLARQMVVSTVLAWLISSGRQCLHGVRAHRAYEQHQPMQGWQSGCTVAAGRGAVQMHVHVPLRRCMGRGRSPRVATVQALFTWPPAGRQASP